MNQVAKNFEIEHASLLMLMRYSEKALVSDIYDTDDEFSSALNNAFGDSFEYPDFSHITVGAVIKMLVKKSELEAANDQSPAAPSLNDKYADLIIGIRADQYDSLEVHGVRDLFAGSEDAGTHFEVDYENPEIYSVYVHLIEGGVESVGDFSEHAMAVGYADDLAVKYGFTLQDLSKCGDHLKLAVKKSVFDAKAIAHAIGPYSFVNAKIDQSHHCKVLAVTDHHVVLSLGRSAAVVAQSDLDRVPTMGEDTTIVFKNGKGLVADVARFKGVDKGR